MPCCHLCYLRGKGYYTRQNQLLRENTKICLFTDCKVTKVNEMITYRRPMITEFGTSVLVVAL